MADAQPRELDLSTDTVLTLSRADMALGRLAGAGRLPPNPHLLLTPNTLREAVSSSRIVGTQTSLFVDHPLANRRMTVRGAQRPGRR